MKPQAQATELGAGKGSCKPYPCVRPLPTDLYHQVPQKVLGSLKPTDCFLFGPTLIQTPEAADEDWSTHTQPTSS